MSNFNNSTNAQGTGTTIVAITPGQNPATAPVFFSSQAVGLTESLSVLKSGFVIVGNVPTTSDTIGPGSLQIINRFGAVVQTLSDANTNSNLFDGPWASAVNDKGNTAQLFVSNLESGAITRINFKVVKKHGQANLKVVSMTQIASGYTVMTSPGSPQTGDVYVQTNLVSDIAGMAPNTDPNLQGAWGLSFSTTSPFWVSDQAANFNGSGAASVYKVSDTAIPTSSGSLLTVGVTNQGDAPPSPTRPMARRARCRTGAPGITTGSTDFLVGTVQGRRSFSPISTARSRRGTGVRARRSRRPSPVPRSPGWRSGTPRPAPAQLYAADQNSGNIDVFNSKWQMTGSFTDPNFANFPTGYAAFNVQNLSVNGTQTLFVTYANQSTGGRHRG